jgi:hypothetical protein
MAGPIAKTGAFYPAHASARLNRLNKSGYGIVSQQPWSPK